MPVEESQQLRTKPQSCGSEYETAKHRILERSSDYLCPTKRMATQRYSTGLRAMRTLRLLGSALSKASKARIANIGIRTTKFLAMT